MDRLTHEVIKETSKGLYVSNFLHIMIIQLKEIPFLFLGDIISMSNVEKMLLFLIQIRQPSILCLSKQ